VRVKPVRRPRYGRFAVFFILIGGPLLLQTSTPHETDVMAGFATMLPRLSNSSGVWLTLPQMLKYAFGYYTTCTLYDTVPAHTRTISPNRAHGYNPRQPTPPYLVESRAILTFSAAESAAAQNRNVHRTGGARRCHNREGDQRIRCSGRASQCL